MPKKIIDKDSEYHIHNFKQLYDFALVHRMGGWMFRGVPDRTFTLIPRVGRTKATALSERAIWQRFVREAVQYSGISDFPEKQLERLALGQHHGLPTRLLDWTYNPLVAAYFACKERPNVDGAIYVFQSKSPSVSSDSDPFAFASVRRYRPHHVTRRIAAQQGVFTIHPRPASPLPLGKTDDYEIKRCIVNADGKKGLDGIWQDSELMRILCFQVWTV